MPKTPEYTFEDHLDEAINGLSTAEHHVSRMGDLLEDGGTDFDRRVKDLAVLLRLVNQEIGAIRKEFVKNNRDQVR